MKDKFVTAAAQGFLVSLQHQGKILCDGVYPTVKAEKVIDAFEAGAEWQREQENAGIREREALIADLRDKIKMINNDNAKLEAERDEWRLVPRGPFPPKPEVPGVSQTEIMAEVKRNTSILEGISGRLHDIERQQQHHTNELQIVAYHIDKDTSERYVGYNSIMAMLDAINKTTVEILTAEPEVINQTCDKPDEKEDASGLKAMFDAIPDNPVKRYGDYDASPAGEWSPAIQADPPGVVRYNGRRYILAD